MAGPFRVIIVGDSSVGKTAISHRCVENVFYSEHVPTLGVDFKYCTFSADETGASQPIRLAVWDSAGQETFLSITQQFIRGADAAFLCYDITDTKSYQNAISNWRERIAGEKGGNIKIVLVGCKCDLEGMRAVSKSEAAAWASQNNVPFFETSAKENQNVRPAFSFLAKQLFDQQAAQRASTSGGSNTAGEEGGAKKNTAVRISPGANNNNAAGGNNGNSGSSSGSSGGGKCGKC